MPTKRFDFDFESPYTALALLFGATPSSAHVEVSEDGTIESRFGFVSIRTDASNVDQIERSGDYNWWKAIGIRSSLKDRGLTFGSSTRRGVCLKFKAPVKAKPSLFGLAHPGLTLTLQDPDAFVAAVEAVRSSRG